MDNLIQINPKDETMTFIGAIECITDGCKVHKLEWENKEYYGVLADGKLMLHKPDGILYPWIISDGDLNGEDYIVI